MRWFCVLLIRRPYLVVLAISVLCLACIIVSLTVKALPNFSDPSLGFEARGTEIGKRLTAWHNLIKETGPNGALVANPNDLLALEEEIRRKNRRKKNGHKNKSKGGQFGRKTYKSKNNIHKSFGNRYKESETRLQTQWNGDSGIFHDYEITNDTLSTFDHGNHSEQFEYGQNKTFVDEDIDREKLLRKKSTWRVLKQAAIPPSCCDGYRLPIDGFFCNTPDKGYSHFVIKRVGPNATDTLFDLNSLLAMCQLQEQITAVNMYKDYCEREMTTDNCCRPWSLANYATLLANKSSCFELNQTDVITLQNLLVDCFDYYHDLKLSNDCNEYNPCYAPATCLQHNIVFNVLHYMTDINFIKHNDSNIYLKYSMIFVPVSQSEKILPLFYEWEKAYLKNQILQVVAMDVGLENTLFNECLLTDGWLVALGGIFVMMCIWLYTTSIFLTLMTYMAVLFSIGLAYFLYTVVFEMSFFPYMNLLSVVVVIGIGADGVFIFVKIWQCVLADRFSNKTSGISMQSPPVQAIESENTETLQNLMQSTLKHAVPSMFVSSLTTACAFYSSYISSISAIKCFGIFAGTAVVTNLLLMVTWLPACVSIAERISACTTCSKLHVQKLLIMFHKSINTFYKVFETAIINAVMKYAFLWIVLFAFFGVASAVIVVYWPGLQLPKNSHFQLFVSSHPFEIYNTKLKNEFWFEKAMSFSYENFKMPLRFVWGVLPKDDGDYVDPSSYGNLYYDNNFNISTKAAQMWLFEFCQQIKKQPFYQKSYGLILPHCFIVNFISLMDRVCIDGMDNYTDRTPCCNVSKFPYEPEVFDLCLPQIISALYATPREYFIPGVAGPKFLAQPYNSLVEENRLNKYENNVNITDVAAHLPEVKAIVIEFDANMTYTTDYQKVRLFVESVEKWFKSQLDTAPIEMRGGWFTSELKFFDVQDTLARDTIFAISTAMGASLIILFVVTLNVLISIYAIITVSMTIFATVAILILLGWELNILESIAVSTAIGLVVDYSLHYGIHYRLSPTSERIIGTEYALSRILGPTAMAAVTTGAAGALMLASKILPYIQIGIFLIVVTGVSWLYATFFLMSLLRVAGPQYGFMQFSLPKFRKHSTMNGKKYYDRKQSQVVASEQLLTPSSSAIGDPINSETHELDSLTSNMMIKTISGTTTEGQNAIRTASFEHRPRNYQRDITNAKLKRHNSGDITNVNNFRNSSTENITETKNIAFPVSAVNESSNNFVQKLS